MALQLLLAAAYPYVRQSFLRRARSRDHLP
jgi:hypothetical protein